MSTEKKQEGELDSAGEQSPPPPETFSELAGDALAGLFGHIFESFVKHKDKES
jgi:hypothetical protein